MVSFFSCFVYDIVPLIELDASYNDKSKNNYKNNYNYNHYNNNSSVLVFSWWLRQWFWDLEHDIQEYIQLVDWLFVSKRSVSLTVVEDWVDNEVYSRCCAVLVVVNNVVAVIEKLCAVFVFSVVSLESWLLVTKG